MTRFQDNFYFGAKFHLKTNKQNKTKTTQTNNCKTTTSDHSSCRSRLSRFSFRKVADFKLPDKLKLPARLRKLRRTRSRRRTRSDPGLAGIEVYEDALSVCTLPTERRKVDSAGYTEVLIIPEGTQAASPDAGPSEYHVLGASEYRPHSASDPQNSCRAYNHVVLVPRPSDLRTSDNGVGRDAHVQAVTPTENEYDVSVVAMEVSRVQVIGELYDKLQNLPQ